MAISAECVQYMGKALKRLATGDVDGFDLDDHDFKSKTELQLVQGLKDIQQAMVSVTEQKLQNADFQGQIEAINASQGVIQFHPDGTIITANDIILGVMGYTLYEIIGKHHSKFVETDYKNSTEYRQFWEDLRAGKTQVGEVMRLGKDNKKIWLQASYTPIKDPSGEVFKVVKYATNITEQKNLEAEYEKRFKAIASGNFSAEITPRSDKDTVGIALLDMTNTLRQVTAAAVAIANGDFSTTVEVKGEQDLLGTAINRMTQKLIAANEKNRRENWLKDGQSRLADAIRGELDITMLVDKSLSTLATYLNAQVGVFYVAEDDSDELTLCGTYAYDRRKRLNTTIVPGQGILGQAVKEKKSFILEELPDGHISVDTGLGNSAPRNLVVMPVLYAGSVRGVLELGSFKPFSDEHHTLLKLVSESLAIAINSAQDRAQLAVTLVKAQSQAEELQAQQEELAESNQKLAAQQEELRVSNEELTVQAKELKRSEEELQVSNEKLSEKTYRLEEQQREMETKNDNLMVIQQKLEEKARALALSSKYKSEFLANMSHELRTPLNSLLILSNSFAKNSTGNLTEEQVQEAEVIHSGAQSLLELINDILDLSKVEAGKLDVTLEKVELRTFADHLEQLFAPVAKDKGLEFEVRLAAGMPESITTDGQRAQQIIKNLVANATKFTFAGSVILEIAPADHATQFFNGELVPASTVAISVRDTGIGIPVDKQQLIFEAFQQADGSNSRQYGGTGLGLTISRELTRLLGGEIQLKSEEGVGSTFTLYLPIKSIAKQIDQTGNPVPVNVVSSETSTTAFKMECNPVTCIKENDITPIPRPPFNDDRDELNDKDKSVLIIEDDIDFAKLLVKLARTKGYKCLVATQGKIGLKLATTYSPSAIMLDLGLPDVDGIKVLDDLKYDVRTRHIPVHIVTGQKATNDSLIKGALGIIQKPITETQLDGVFARFEELSNKKLFKILLVEDEASNVTAVRNLLQAKHVEITVAASGLEALSMLEVNEFDCMVLDLNLPDISGFEVLDKAGRNDSLKLPPVIVYTGRELTREEHNLLEEHAATIVIKGAASPERLLSEVSLFLHSVDFLMSSESKLPMQKLQSQDNELLDRHVLLVDDYMRNCFALSKVLREAGLKVTMAENGRKALDLLAGKESFGLVIMDIMMPIMDGYEAIREIRKQEHFEKLPIIALTAKVLPEDRAKCLDVGANDYLAKPVEEDKLLSLIRVLLCQNRQVA